MINPHAATADLADASGPTTVDRDAIKALIGSALGYAMDGFDLSDPGLHAQTDRGRSFVDPAQAASLVTATLIGAVIGGIGFGMLSDRIGRVRVLTYTIVVFAVFTGLCGFAQGYYDLLFLSHSRRRRPRRRVRHRHGAGRRSLAVDQCAPAPRLMSGSAGSSACLPRRSSRRSCCRSSAGAACSCSAFFPAVAAYFIRSSLHEPEVFVKKSHDHPKESALHLLVDRTPRPPSSASA